MPNGEFDLIKRHLSALGSVRDDVHLGVGDDAALVNVEAPGCRTACAHVDFAQLSPAATATAIERAFTDIDRELRSAGFQPAWATLALTLSEADDALLEQLAQAIHASCVRHGIAVIGGDTTRGENSLTVFVNAPGAAPVS